MIDSFHWRPRIVPGKWKFSEYFTSLPDGCLPLKRCLGNPEFISAISEPVNPAAIVLWSTILWLKYKELIPEVREQLEAVKKKAAQLDRKTDPDMYLTNIDSELEKARDTRAQYDPWSTDQAVVDLKTKIDNLRQARAALRTFRRGRLYLGQNLPIVRVCP